MAASSPMRPTLLTGVAVAAALAVGGCARGGGDAPPEARDQAVAKVNGETVWLSDVRREAEAQGLIAKGERLDQASEAFRDTLGQVVDRKLLAAEAVKRGLDKDAATERRLADARDRVLGDRLIEVVVAEAATEPAIQGLYREQLKASRRDEQIRARQIVTATQAEAQAALKLLNAGAAFEPLALQRSTDPATRFAGGDLGWFTLEVMPPAYAVALSGVQPGALVGPFEVDGRWVILKLEERRLEPPITLAAVRPQLVRFLTYDRIRDLVEKLRSRAKIETLVKSEPPLRPAQPSPAPATSVQEGRS